MGIQIGRHRPFITWLRAISAALHGNRHLKKRHSVPSTRLFLFLSKAARMVNGKGINQKRECIPQDTINFKNKRLGTTAEQGERIQFKSVKMLRVCTGKRQQQRRAEELRRENEQRRTAALQLWERKLGCAERDGERISTRRGQKLSSRQQLEYVDVNNVAKEEAVMTTVHPSKRASLGAKRMQQLEQAHAIYRFFDSLGGREA